MNNGTNVDAAILIPTLSSINECRTERGLAPIADWQCFIAYSVACYTIHMSDPDSDSSLIPSNASIFDVFGGDEAFREACRAVMHFGDFADRDFVAGLESSFIERIDIDIGPPSPTDLTDDGFATGLYVLFLTLLKRDE